MGTQTKTVALLEAIERRLAEISTRQHALAVEKTRLIDQITPLRLGVASPDLALAQLRAQGVTLHGVAAAWVAERGPRGVLLESVIPRGAKVTPLPAPRSETNSLTGARSREIPREARPPREMGPSQRRVFRARPQCALASRTQLRDLPACRKTSGMISRTVGPHGRIRAGSPGKRRSGSASGSPGWCSPWDRPAAPRCPPRRQPRPTGHWHRPCVAPGQEAL
jgi:hypothetical protein